jgi:hypothetical protein
LLLSGWRRSDQSRLPALATGISLVWAGVWTAGFLDLTRSYALVTVLEWARGLAWLIASLAILREITRMDFASWLRSGYGIFILLLAAIPVGYFAFSSYDPPQGMFWIAGGYVLSLLIVLAAEQCVLMLPICASRSPACSCLI